MNTNLKDLYQSCVSACTYIAEANNVGHENQQQKFVVFRYVDIDRLFQIRENKSLQKLYVVYPGSKISKAHADDGYWISDDDRTIFNIMADFSSIHFPGGENMYTIQVWAPFVNKLISLFRHLKVEYVRF